MRRLVSAAQKHTVIIPKDPTKGSYIGGQCTCGLVKHDAVPCEHMAMIVVSSRIDVLTRHNIMPMNINVMRGVCLVSFFLLLSSLPYRVLNYL
jgi:hypothetical protein